MNQQMKLIIAGGGTGGHIFPAVAIAHAVQRMQPAAEVLFVGAEGKMEMEKVPQEGFRIIGLPIAGFNRSHLLKNISLPFKMIKSALQARKIIREFKPDVVVGVGGYASFPVLFSAQRAGIPTLIQEQNSYAGKSNKILAKRANLVCVAYENMQQFFPARKIVLTGNPVRKSISASTITREEGRSAFGITGEKPVVLVIGGSLGARSINQAIGAGLGVLSQMNIQIIWQCGQGYYETAVKEAEGLGKFVQVHAFIRQMDYAYAAADLVISRAGALAIAELCIAGKPVIFVPFPFAAEDHQTSNAMALVQHNASQLVRDSDTATELIPRLKALLEDPKTQTVMQEALARLAITDADERIATKVISLATTNPSSNS